MNAASLLIVSSLDYERLEKLIAISPRSATRDLLEEELGRAAVVPPEQIPPDVVTMNSRVRFKDLSSAEEMEVVLVYPSEADAAQGKVSILAPVGAALLGLPVGGQIEWPMPNGKKRALQIVSVIFQPEREGNYQL